MSRFGNVACTMDKYEVVRVVRFKVHTTYSFEVSLLIMFINSYVVRLSSMSTFNLCVKSQILNLSV
jgi:hypothetical protein